MSMETDTPTTDGPLAEVVKPDAMAVDGVDDKCPPVTATDKVPEAAIAAASSHIPEPAGAGRADEQNGSGELPGDEESKLNDVAAETTAPPAGAGGESGAMEGATAGGGDSSGPNGQGGAANQDMEDETGQKEGFGVSVPVARVRRMMRYNPDKKKNFSKEAVFAVAAGMELFLADFAKTTYQFTAEKNRKTLLLADVAECIKLIPRFEFLDGPGILPDAEERSKRAKGSHASAAANAAPAPAPVPGVFAAPQPLTMAGTTPASALGFGPSPAVVPAPVVQQAPVSSAAVGSANQSTLPSSGPAPVLPNEGGAVQQQAAPGPAQAAQASAGVPSGSDNAAVATSAPLAQESSAQAASSAPAAAGVVTPTPQVAVQ